jgi:hypothetical protein
MKLRIYKRNEWLLVKHIVKACERKLENSTNNVKLVNPNSIPLISVRQNRSSSNHRSQSIYIENITPETLDECDREYDRLDEMYRIRKPILDAFEQWKLLAQQHAEFQVGFD